MPLAVVQSLLFLDRLAVDARSNALTPGTAANIQRSTFNVQRSTLNAQRSTLNVQRRLPDAESSTFSRYP
jgi:hypothetical protein